MALDSANFKPVTPGKYHDDYHGKVNYNAKGDYYKTTNIDGLKNLTLVVPAKMTMSTADYVCESGVWMRMHTTENVSALPKCSTEEDVGKLKNFLISPLITN